MFDPVTRKVIRGATNAFAQASVLDLYDPDRSQTMRHGAGSTNWEDVNGAIRDVFAGSPTGAGVAILTGTITSPSLLAQMKRIRAQRPQLKWHVYEPINQDNVKAGIKAAFGKELHPVYHFDRADVIVSLDSNFLHEEPGHVQYARDFVSRRRVTNKVEEDADGNPVLKKNAGELNRLYVIESTPTITGAKADHRFPVPAAAVEGVARQLAAAVGVDGVNETPSAWVQAIANDFKGKKVLVIPGFQQPAAVHALAHAINAKLGNAGAAGTVSYHAPVEGSPAAGTLHNASIADLVSDMSAGKVKALFILSGNPAYDAPADLKFADALTKLNRNPKAMVLHFGTHENETSTLCGWHVPEAHYLETWGDARSVDGSLAIIQPLVQPLYEGAKAPLEMLAAIAAQANATSHDLLLDFHTRRLVKGSFDPNVSAYSQLNDAQRLSFDRTWTSAVHDGGLKGFETPVVGVGLAGDLSAVLAAPAPAVPDPFKEPTENDTLEVNFRPDPTIWDGRFANNPWLQELPKSMTKTVWDNAIFVSPATAHVRDWRTNQEMVLEVNGQKVTGSIVLLPGQPNNTLTVHLGYGRTYAGKVGTGPGFNAYLLRTSKSPWFTSGAKVTPTGGVYKIATTSQQNVIAPAGKEASWKHALNPLKPAADNQTKVVDNILTPEVREFDMDGTHGRDLIRSGTWEALAATLQGKKSELPVSIKDKRGVPIAFPDNPYDIQKKVAKAIAEPGEGHQHEPSGPSPKGSVALNEDNAYGQPQGRSVEGFVSFYPRNNDPHALKPYRDESANAEAEQEAKALKRDDYTYAWGMTIDLQTCIGCNACVTACQSENNIAVVGKDQILMGRGMHWIRIDAYYRGSFENPEVHFEPMTCQHCEKAPCAPVCPFNATMNSSEGINEQVYNRCVGTKYCENNCPYKVRRFNFLQYSDQQTPVIQLMQNPDVTVRSRGVMEKCTYCIQRVNYAKFQAEKEERRVRDGEILVGCQQACPTDAIVFGDINDPNSKVSQLKRGPLTFGLLTELDTMPRTSYLASFTNPNPDPALKDFQPSPMLGAGEEAEGEEAGGETEGSAEREAPAPAH
jgi:molybdopterin-containing oxidoreductase family iron-sulfur binding subunit